MQIKGKQIDETMKLINRRTYEKHNDLFFGIFISRWYQVLNKRVSYSSNTPREYSLSLINFYLFVCVCVCVCVYVSVFVSAMSLTLNFCSALFSQKVGGIYIYVNVKRMWNEFYHEIKIGKSLSILNVESTCFIWKTCVHMQISVWWALRRTRDVRSRHQFSLSGLRVSIFSFYALAKMHVYILSYSW